MKKFVLMAGVGMAFIAAPAVAYEGGGAGGDRAAHHAEMMKKFDKDGDGALNKDEFVAMSAERSATMFDRLDKNKDGKVTPDERPKRGEGRKGRNLGGDAPPAPEKAEPLITE